MSKKVNNLRKRMRQLEQQNAKGFREIAERGAKLYQKEVDLAKREKAFVSKPKVDDAIVAIVVRRHDEYRRRGQTYAFQLIVDFDDLRRMVFKDQRDMGACYGTLYWIQDQMKEQITKLYTDILKAECPEMREAR
jgi:hypothetical protein